MKKLTHDYTLPSEAESHLYAAQQLNAHDDPVEAWKHIEDARRLLQQYISQDNMVEDDEVEGGYVRYNDVQELLDKMERMQQGRGAQYADPASSPSAQKVEKHKGIDSRFLTQQLDGADPSNPLYNKIVVESGTYEQIGMTRDEVAEALQRLGAKLNRSVSRTIQVFVTGNKPGPAKIKQVQELRAAGNDIRILTQIELKEIIDKYIG